MITREQLVKAAKEGGRLLLIFAASAALAWTFEHFLGLGWLPLIAICGWRTAVSVWGIVKDVHGIVTDRRAVRAWKRRVVRHANERAEVEVEPLPQPSVTQVRDAVGNIWERTGTNRWDIVLMSPELPGERVRLEPQESTALGWNRLSRFTGPLTPIEPEETA